MTDAEFRATLTDLGWTSGSLARLLGIPRQTVLQWHMGRTAVPEVVAHWVAGRLASLQADPPPYVRDQRLRPE